MNLIEGIKLKGCPATIPDCSRDNLPELLVSMGLQTGAEIGVLLGTYTRKFCEAGIKMYAIDPWMPFKGQGRGQRQQEIQDRNYERAKQALEPYVKQDLCTIIRKTSDEAVKQFRGGSLDFVYIDGNHDFSHVAHDIYEWSLRVRSGGVVAGHDYFDTWVGATNTISHVQAIVDAYTRLYGISNWWLFGGNMERGNDRVLSWMWVKP